MANRYGKGLIGAAVVVALLALLVHWIGIDTIARYRDDLGFYLQAHLVLVLASMAAALAVGIPAGGIFSSLVLGLSGKVYFNQIAYFLGFKDSYLEERGKL